VITYIDYNKRMSHRDLHTRTLYFRRFARCRRRVLGMTLMWDLLNIFFKVLQALSSCAEGVDIFTESEAAVCLANTCVLFAIELEAIVLAEKLYRTGKCNGNTSLTGIEETPISVAMNQQALNRSSIVRFRVFGF
jgi:hypothetical protein